MPLDDPVAGRVTLRPGRDKPVRQRHPWVFSGAIAGVAGDPAPGALVDVTAADGSWLGRGTLNPASQIVVRLLSWDESEVIDTPFWRRRLARAISARGDTGPETAVRLVNAESDGLPGLVVDRYGPWLVAQALTLGIAARLPALAALLAELAPAGLLGIYERSDVDVRSREGLPPATGPLWGAEPPERLTIAERGPGSTTLRCLADLRRGHKTGLYLDQAANRRAVGAACAGRSVLNLFSYTGGFGLHAWAGGARSVMHVDTSAAALVVARENTALNGFAVADEDFVTGDGWSVLRRLRAAGRRFEAIVLDPPKLAHKQGDVDRAARAYKDANLVALQLLAPGGVLATFSCSGLVSADLFQKIVFGAAVDAGRDVQILAHLGQAPDHPVLLTFPEGTYLKGLLCRAW
jgi:23S rRNA (cytosine1962-C5)-methyltransferase